MNIPGFRLHFKNPQIVDEPNAQKSSVKSAIQKNLPYLHTEKGKDKLNLNGVVPFEGQDDSDEVDKETIVCRHFSAVLGLNALARPDGKILLPTVDSPKHIAANIKKEAEQQYKSIRANSSNVSAFDNDNFADFLQAQFRSMYRQPSTEGDALAAFGEATREAGSDDAPYQTKGIKTFLIQSTNHAMLLRLRLKEKEGVPVYVVSFYDPNRTACLVRCEVSDLAELGKIAGSHSLAAFINPMVDGQADTEDYKNYFPQNTAEIALAIEVPQPGTVVSPEMKVTGRKLQSCDCKTSPTLMFHLMTVGFPGSIDEITASFIERGTAPDRALLEAKKADGPPGLFMALQNGHAEAISAWGKLLALLPHKQRDAIIQGLLEAKNADGTPGLYIALQDGHAEAIAAWGKLLALLPDNAQRSSIIEGVLEAKDPDGVPLLHIALETSHADAIAAWGKLLALLPDNEQRGSIFWSFLEAKNTDGNPVLYWALLHGYAKAIESWGKLLTLLPDDKHRSEIIRDLLVAKNPNGTPGLYLALQDGHAEAIGVWGKLLALLPDNAQRGAFIEGLLKAKNPDGIPGLLLALQNGHAEAIGVWGELLSLLPDDERRSTTIKFLLEAKSATGIPGLFMALQDGHADAIKTWGNLLNTLPKYTSAKELAKLIFAVCDDGDTALEALLYAEDEETSSAWQALLAYLPASVTNLKTAAITALKSDDLESLVTLRQELNNVLADITQ